MIAQGGRRDPPRFPRPRSPWPSPSRPRPRTRTSSACRSRWPTSSASSPTCERMAEENQAEIRRLNEVAGRADRPPEAAAGEPARPGRGAAVGAARHHGPPVRAGRAAAGRCSAAPAGRARRRRSRRAPAPLPPPRRATLPAAGRGGPAAARAVQPGLRRLRARQLRPGHPGLHGVPAAPRAATDLVDNAQYWIGECLVRQAELRGGDRGLGRAVPRLPRRATSCPTRASRRAWPSRRLGRRQRGPARVPVRGRPLPELPRGAHRAGPPQPLTVPPSL